MQLLILNGKAIFNQIFFDGFKIFVFMKNIKIIGI